LHGGGGERRHPSGSAPWPLPAEAADLRALAERLPAVLDDLRVLDPAVGSGAFPLGVLAEIIRLKTLAQSHLTGAEPSADSVYRWKEHAIQHVLYGVDIEPRAIELCRLRYWLWLLVDLPLSIEPHPLPNLEYRTVVANSLVDFASGVEIQNTRGGLSFFHNPQLVRLHDQWFAATGDEKTRLRVLIDRAEEDEIEALFQRARDSASARHRHGPEAVAAELAHIDEIATRFRSRDREFPCFAPALHAPEIAERGGWDIVNHEPPVRLQEGGAEAAHGRRGR
jgi:adenine-specific DNA-methyltransferase